MVRERGRWCENCGARLGDGDEACPACGMPAPLPEKPAKLPPAKKKDEEKPDETNVMAKIESAIPPEDDATSPVVKHDRMPRTRIVVATMCVAVALVSGVVLYITHPWDPDAYDISATEEADTSWAGFPGFIEKLRGQDLGSSSQTVTSADEATLASLTDAHERFAALAERVDESEELFGEIAFSGSATERQDAYAQAQALSLEISNLISEVEGVDVNTGTYVEARSELVTMGNYLRNRMDALLGAWELDAASDNPEDEREAIEAPLTNSDGVSITDSFKRLFDDAYEKWDY